MKLAILGTRGIPAAYGGFETFAEELSRRLAQRGTEVTVYCEAGEGKQLDTFEGVSLVHLPAPRVGPFTTILFDLLCLWHARKAYDVVYMLGYGSSIFCFLPRLWGSKVWINMDGIEWARSKWGPPARLWFKAMEAAAMRTPNRVIADAAGILQHLQSRHTRAPCACVIPYGALVPETPPDSGLLAARRLSPGKYYLVVCRLEPENSVRTIIAGYLRSDSEFPLIVVGGTDPATSYVRELLQLNNGRVRFIGPVYEKKKLQALRYYALAYFHGHSVGGTNPSLLEALGCGNLVVAHDNVFNREVAGEAASYFNQESDVTRIIRAIESYTEQQMKRMKTEAKERVSRNYCWDAVTDQYLALLKKPGQ